MTTDEQARYEELVAAVKLLRAELQGRPGRAAEPRGEGPPRVYLAGPRPRGRLHRHRRPGAVADPGGGVAPAGVPDVPRRRRRGE